MSAERWKVPDSAVGHGLRHLVLFYRDAAEYQACVTQFVQAAAIRGEPVLIAVPHHVMHGPGREGGPTALNPDMAELGRNPARVLPAVRAFCDAHPASRALIIAEWIWPGRSHAETCEAARYEALVEQALSELAVTIVCAYSEAALPAWVLADAGRAHRWQVRPEGPTPSATYAGPDATPASCRVPLPSPPPDAEVIQYRSDLRPVRAMVSAEGKAAGLPANRVTDLMLAASEVAANTLRHTQAAGVALAWRTDGEVLCQITDSGYIADPLAGVRRPPPGEPGGQGLWLVNQLCDLVELRSTHAGTLVRLHMKIDRP